MAFDKRGWRKFVVDKAVYFWRMPNELDSPDAFVVRPEVKPYRLLRVVGCRCGQTVGGVEGDRPLSVRDAIRSAARYGWPAERPHLRLHATTNTCYLAADPPWVSETVVALAAGIYADGAFDRMPILADALEEAGCDNPDVLNHCRGAGPHARGCWVVELLLNQG